MTPTTTTDAVRLELEPIGAEEMRGRHGAGRLEQWDYTASHYRATLIYQGRRADFRYATGSGWQREPVAREVLESILSDAGYVQDADTVAEVLEELRLELGEDDATRETADALLRNARKLRRLLDDDYDAAAADPSGWAWAHTPDPPDHITRADRAPAGRSWSGRIGTHRDGYPVRIEVELRDRDGFDELAITGTTPYAAGQCVDELDAIATPAAPWTSERIAELAEIWRRWHLNGMNAACEHQRALGWTYDERSALEKEGDPDARTCPTCGYAIGSAWLKEELPAEVRTWLREVLHIG